MGTSDLLSEDQQAEMRQSAIDRCTHPDEWVSRTEPGYTADACWSCLLDAYFDLKECPTCAPRLATSSVSGGSDRTGPGSAGR